MLLTEHKQNDLMQRYAIAVAVVAPYMKDIVEVHKNAIKDKFPHVVENNEFKKLQTKYKFLDELQNTIHNEAVKQEEI
ncbi:hypothetical protein G3R49_19285 [Shewanella sp. WXL01]|uniref:hypothetical protein n=1 Tax=Shewanella sp. WXL01 TaxID=2709721 RepID=UPI0014386417|nr:hypothetical protein [Shewanella sp. WXL01]NKF52703.1 hypothetical protein [Shewanella sp. WXL01]